jgi:hypothetical protein
MRSRNEPPPQVWTVLETAANTAAVVAVKLDEGAAQIAAKVRRARHAPGDGWRVTVTGPHEVNSDYI